jgi:hypothetical protein
MAMKSVEWMDYLMAENSAYLMVVATVGLLDEK